jgi:murein DD-endopeptidase MepM/ murein hydrolase activator NlpD
VYNGSLVKIGDKVHRGQKIALSGNTGQSTVEHLHFSSLVPVNSEGGLKSVPIEFVGGIKAIHLKKGDVLKK